MSATATNEDPLLKGRWGYASIGDKISAIVLQRPLGWRWLLAFVLLWWVGAWLAADPQRLPAPDRVLALAWREILDGTLPLNVGITLTRVLAAFAVAMIVGSVLGYLAGRFSFKSFATGEMIVPPEALAALALEGIPFSVEGPATYERYAPQVRTAAPGAV